MALISFCLNFSAPIPLKCSSDLNHHRRLSVFFLLYLASVIMSDTASIPVSNLLISFYLGELPTAYTERVFRAQPTLFVSSSSERGSHTSLTTLWPNH